MTTAPLLSPLNRNSSHITQTYIGLLKQYSPGSTGIAHLISFTEDGTISCQCDAYGVVLRGVQSKIPVRVVREKVGFGCVHKVLFTPAVEGNVTMHVSLYVTNNVAMEKGGKSMQLLTLKQMLQEAEHPPLPANDTVGDRRQKRANRISKPTWCLNTFPYADDLTRTVSISVSKKTHNIRNFCTEIDDTPSEGTWEKLDKNGSEARYMNTAWRYRPGNCDLRGFESQETWQCFAEKRIRSIVWVGDSTLKDAAVNFIENILKVPVLRRSFNWVHTMCPTGLKLSVTKRKARKKGCPERTSYKNWKILRRNPYNEAQHIKLRFFTQEDAFLGDTSLVARVLKEGPDLVFLNSFEHDPVALDPHRTEQFKAGLNRFIAMLQNGSSPIPMVHYSLPTPHCLSDRYDNMYKMCASSILDTAFTSHAQMHSTDVSTFLQTLPHKVLLTDRFPMAQPFTTGHTHCQRGMHYGRGTKFCTAHFPDNPTSCTRDWTVGKYELMMWLNQVCRKVPTKPVDPMDRRGNLDEGVLREAFHGEHLERLD